MKNTSEGTLASAKAGIRKASKAIRIILPSISALILLPALGGPVAAAGFFETLFGIRPAQQQVHVPRPQYDVPLVSGAQGIRMKPAQRVKAKPAAKIVKAVSATKSSGSSSKSAALRPEVLPGPLGPFLRDPTLRRGDVVVTIDGLKVFTGAANTQHSGSEFAALAHASHFAAGNSSVLAAIDRANRFSAKPLVEVQSVPAAPIEPVSRVDHVPPVEAKPAARSIEAKPTVRVSL